jgi:AraC-like DNA-binding protein
MTKQEDNVTPESQSERQRLERIIDRHLDDCYSTRSVVRASQISDKLNASRTHVTATVGRLFGKPLKAVLLEKQLAYVARLLGVTNLPISEIGKATGFGSRSTFHRVFKRAFGMRPQEYRRQASRRE